MNRRIQQLHLLFIMSRNCIFFNLQQLIIPILTFIACQINFVLDILYFLKKSKKMNNIEFRSIQTKRQKNKWTIEEDDVLSSSIQKYGTNWCKVAQNFPNRNPNSCIQRWKILKCKNIRNIFNHQKITKKKWNQKEDKLLSKLVILYGKKWKKISKYITDKTDKQCLQRYNSTLNPNVNKQPFTEEEDQIIYSNYIILGSKWSIISQKLNKRTPNQVKNRFYSHIISSYLNLQNPYYTKLSSQQAKTVLLKVASEHKQKLLLDNQNLNTSELDKSQLKNTFDLIESCQVEFEDDYSNYHRLG
ncbi:unnamed protein product [Paramecium pentaurelia]|uniref:Myb-like DNA-binding domain protein n=1 Tax=Paramecium pentaurelia TaxID=43138 RepID=A0A8S1XB12_9CILI|nr:unnamed protein product [Paramecium pentaurelia]